MKNLPILLIFTFLCIQLNAQSINELQRHQMIQQMAKNKVKSNKYQDTLIKKNTEKTNGYSSTYIIDGWNIQKIKTEKKDFFKMVNIIFLKEKQYKKIGPSISLVIPIIIVFLMYFFLSRWVISFDNYGNNLYLIISPLGLTMFFMIFVVMIVSSLMNLALEIIIVYAIGLFLITFTLMFAHNHLTKVIGSKQEKKPTWKIYFIILHFIYGLFVLVWLKTYIILAPITLAFIFAYILSKADPKKKFQMIWY